jgi:hypothetical protein
LGGLFRWWRNCCGRSILLREGGKGKEAAEETKQNFAQNSHAHITFN